jgi:hypothetical protein
MGSTFGAVSHPVANQLISQAQLTASRLNPQSDEPETPILLNQSGLKSFDDGHRFTDTRTAAVVGSILVRSRYQCGECEIHPL